MGAFPKRYHTDLQRTGAFCWYPDSNGLHRATGELRATKGTAESYQTTMQWHCQY